MKNVKILTTMEEIKSFSDPYRIIIMKQFFKMNKPATVKQVADEMGEVPAKVHYHVKKMVAAGLLRLNHTKEINGILAKYYEPSAKQFKIDNLEIGQYQFNNQVIDFELLDKKQPLSQPQSKDLSVFERCVLLSASELNAVIDALQNLPEESVQAFEGESIKKYQIRLSVFE